MTSRLNKKLLMQRTTCRYCRISGYGVEMLEPDVTRRKCNRTELNARLAQISKIITCNSTKCKRCKKQYVGGTIKRTFHERFSEHRQATNNSRGYMRQHYLGKREVLTNR